MGRPKGAKNKPKGTIMGRPKGSKVSPVNVRRPAWSEHDTTILEDKTCTSCGKIQKPKEYYNTMSTLFKNDGLTSICKTCIGLIFDEYVRKYDSYKKAMYYTCRKIDLPFSIACYAGANSHSNTSGWKMWQSYMKQLNSFRESNNYGICFDDSDDLIDDNRISEGLLSDMDIDASIEDFEVTIELINKWAHLPKRDILFLEKEYSDWCTRVDLESKSIELIVKEICYQQLMIKGKKERGQPVASELKTLQELMGNGALKPIQESSMQSTGNETFGTLIKKWENEKPIPKPDEDFRDVNNIGKYIKTWFSGHLCKMMGIVNDSSEDYEKELLKYTVNMKCADNSVVEDMDE